MKNIFQFGIKKEGFNVRVLNEREARAAAGILFLFAIIGASMVWFTGNLSFVRLFVVAFTIDFALRVLINPKYAPSLILGKLVTLNQTPDYVGAPQKRFAWSLGLIMALYMFVSLVLLNSMSLVNLIICLICLTLLFMETAFGICVGCVIYKLLPNVTPEACPGGACALKQKDPEQVVQPVTILILALFGALLFFLNPLIQSQPEICTRFSSNCGTDTSPEETCSPPQWAIEIGHENIWKEHHGC